MLRDLDKLDQRTTRRLETDIGTYTNTLDSLETDEDDVAGGGYLYDATPSSPLLSKRDTTRGPGA